MPLRLDHARHDEKQILENLLQLYLHEMCQYSPRELKDDGRFDYEFFPLYFEEAGRHAFIIRLRGRLAGFVMVRTLDTISKTPTYSFAEFFVVESYRRLGIGEEVARLVLDQFQGRWQVGVDTNNKIAKQFWKNVIYRYTGDKFKETTEEGFNGPVYEFNSPGTRPAAEPATNPVTELDPSRAPKSI